MQSREDCSSLLHHWLLTWLLQRSHVTYITDFPFHQESFGLSCFFSCSCYCWELHCSRFPLPIHSSPDSLRHFSNDVTSCFFLQLRLSSQYSKVEIISQPSHHLLPEMPFQTSLKEAAILFPFRCSPQWVRSLLTGPVSHFLVSSPLLLLQSSSWSSLYPTNAYSPSIFPLMDKHMPNSYIHLQQVLKAPLTFSSLVPKTLPFMTFFYLPLKPALWQGTPHTNTFTSLL